MEKLAIHHMAVWAVIILQQLVPPLWYSNLMFAKKWMVLTGLKEEDFSQVNPIQYLVPLLGSICSCYLLAWIFRELEVQTALHGFMLATAMGFAFVFLNGLTKDLFSLRPFALTLINEGMTLILWALSGAIIGAWTRTAG